MKQPLLIKHVLPFIQWYALMIFIAIAIDYGLHYFHLVFIGRYLGVVGTIVVLLSFIYSLRKGRLSSLVHPNNF
ncbi:MAG: hypothetical protein IPP72_15165 [Chitinophagaceae bacterium]|nr:hypothetical protein [Chitinophagaceae bacterium]